VGNPGIVGVDFKTKRIFMKRGLRVVLGFIVLMGSFGLTSLAYAGDGLECEVKHPTSDSVNDLTSLRTKEKSFNGTLTYGVRLCLEKIKFKANTQFNIELSKPLSFDAESGDEDNDSDNNGNNLVLDGSPATSVMLDGSKLNPEAGVCVLNINTVKVVVKNITVKAKSHAKAICDSNLDCDDQCSNVNQYVNVWVQDAAGVKKKLNADGSLPVDPPPPPPAPEPEPEEESGANDEAGFEPSGDEEEPVVEEEDNDLADYTTIVVVDDGVSIDPVFEVDNVVVDDGVSIDPVFEVDNVVVDDGVSIDPVFEVDNGGANNDNVVSNDEADESAPGAAGDASNNASNNASKDDDGDGIANGADNCPLEDNADQADGNNNGLGNVCDPGYKPADEDGDSFANEIDNCPLEPNIEQIDSDADGLGDACDQDFSKVPDDLDGDGVKDDADNCVNVANPDQLDYDQDAAGNTCDMTPGEAPPAPAPMIDPSLAEGGNPAVGGDAPKADEPFLKCTMSLSPVPSSQGLNLGLLSLLLPVGLLLAIRNGRFFASGSE